MPDRDKVLQVVREWVMKAENDLKAAAYLLTLGSDCPTDAVGFHAEQCVEKYLKAFLVSAGIEFPKSHNIRVLVAILPPEGRPSLDDEDQAVLTDYATGARYPGWGEIPLAQARHAVAVARRVRMQMRRTLPAEVLRRRKR